MSEQSKPANLDDILNEYVSLTKKPTHASLMVWVRQYPQFEKELTEFTVSWSVMDVLPHTEEVSKDLEDRLLNKGMSIVQNLLYQKKQQQIDQTQSKKEFEGISDERKKQGLALQYLAERSRLSVGLLSKLEHRHIQRDTIPSCVPENIGRELQIPYQLISNQFQGEPWLDAGSNRLSSKRPKLAPQTNFFDEVRNDRTIKEADRQYWLAMEPKPE